MDTTSTYRLDGAGAVRHREVTGCRDGVVLVPKVEDGGLGAVRHEGVDDAGDGLHARGPAALVAARVTPLGAGTSWASWALGAGAGAAGTARGGRWPAATGGRRGGVVPGGRGWAVVPGRWWRASGTSRTFGATRGSGGAGLSHGLYVARQSASPALMTFTHHTTRGRQQINQPRRDTYRLDGAGTVRDGDIAGGQGGVGDVRVGEHGGLGAVRHEGVDDLGGDHARLEDVRLSRLLGAGGRGAGRGGSVDGSDCSGSREDGENGFGMHLSDVVLSLDRCFCLYVVFRFFRVLDGWLLVGDGIPQIIE